MHFDKRPVVIGGGAAGLAACLTLEQAGISPLLIESSDRLGGRLRTDRLPDGTPVDRGFQVLQTGYPELRRWVDFDALECAEFVPGALVFVRGKWRALADPRRALGWLPATLGSGIGSWSDRFKVLRLVFRLQRAAPAELQNGHFGRPKRIDSALAPKELGRWAHSSTASFFKEWGFSDAFVKEFLGPFFSGIFLEGLLETPAAQFHYTFLMLSSGKVVRPKAGMEALVEQLAAQLTSTEVMLGCRVQAGTDTQFEVDGQPLSIAKGAILAVPGLHPAHPEVKWNACLNAVFQTSTSRFGKPVIGLIPGAEKVTNLHFMEDLEGAQGKGRVNVTALYPNEGETLESAIRAIRTELHGAGVECGELEWSAVVHHALPRICPVGNSTAGLALEEGLFGAGDALMAPSLDGAMRSGRMAAEALIEWIHRA